MTRHLLAVVGFALASCDAGPAEPDPPQPSGHLEYVSTIAEQNRLSLQRLGFPVLAVELDDGISLFPVQASQPGWVVASSDRGPHREQLAHRDLSGTLVRFGPEAERVRDPAISSDGRSAVVASSAESFSDLYRIDLLTGETERITRDGDGAFDPAFARDGSIVFVTTRDGSPDLHILSASGERRALTSGPAHDTDPTVSPDGSHIAFVSNRSGASRIWLASRASGPPRTLTHLVGDNRHEIAPCFSPDGREIAYLVADDRGGKELWIATLDGEARRVDGAEVPQPPLTWSPDSSFVGYAGRQDGSLDVYVAPARSAGSSRKVSDGPGDHWLPRWRRTAP